MHVQRLLFCVLICVQTTGPGDEGSSISAAARRGSVLPTAGAHGRRWESEEKDDWPRRTETGRSEKQVTCTKEVKGVLCFLYEMYCQNPISKLVIIIIYFSWLVFCGFKPGPNEDESCWEFKLLPSALIEFEPAQFSVVTSFLLFGLVNESWIKLAFGLSFSYDLARAPEKWHINCCLWNSVSTKSRRFSIECRKNKTKPITMANHSKRTQRNEPMRTRSKYT